jgi:hypothetical protein
MEIWNAIAGSVTKSSNKGQMQFEIGVKSIIYGQNKTWNIQAVRKGGKATHSNLWAFGQHWIQQPSASMIASGAKRNDNIPLDTR